MSSDIELEARLRSQLAAERQTYQPPAELTARIQRAIRDRSLPSRRPGLIPQLAAAAGLIALVAVLSVGAAWIKNGGLGRSDGLSTGSSAKTYQIATSPKGSIYLLAGASGVL